MIRFKVPTGLPVEYDSCQQVWRWSRQYAAQLKGPPLPEMQQLIEWLEGHIPESDSDPSQSRISHGDYR